MILFKKKTAMTLTELLVSLVLIGIVMLGMASMDYAVRKSQQTTTQSGLLAMQTGAMMLDITKAISLATGDRTNVGILSSDMVGAPFNGPTNLCVRQDLSAAGNPNNTPNTLTDDTWVCYTLTAHQLLTCRGLPGAPAAACGAASTQLGKLFSMNVSVVTNTAQGAQSFYVSLTLTNQSDTESPMNPLNNPNYVLQSLVYPGIHSWSIP